MITEGQLSVYRAVWKLRPTGGAHSVTEHFVCHSNIHSTAIHSSTPCEVHLARCLLSLPPCQLDAGSLFRLFATG